jgi:hypothetical protein
MKKPIVAFTFASDPKNIEYLRKMVNSLRKFHSEEELPLITYGSDVIKTLRDENPLNNKRLSPLITRNLIKEYDTVLHLDADQIITGSLDRLIKMKDYDAAGPYNLNRIDPKRYGVVKVWDIEPKDYFNLGTFAVRSEEFAEHWWSLCNSYHINNYQYHEQDIFNIVAHFGNYKVVRLDEWDAKENYGAFYGLSSKGEGLRMKVVGNELILPKADDGYPLHDMVIKIIHFAGGDSAVDKFNYKIFYNDEVNKYLDNLIDGKKEIKNNLEQ